MTLTAIHIEGNLIAPDLTADLSLGEIKGQTNLDFGFDKSVKLEDEIAFAWGEAKDQWRIYQRRLERLKETDTATSETREYWAVPLLKLLGYEPVYQAKTEIIDGQPFAISHRSNQGLITEEIHPSPPIHIIGSRRSLDKKPPAGASRLSAHALVQEYLNKTEHLWGLVTNGLCWRLLRDCSLMTRLSYLEFDLEQILNGENFAEFSLFYRLFHRSRLPLSIDNVDECILEYYHQEALQQGGRVRNQLRDGVEEVLRLLGNGFLQHRHNNSLREALTPTLPLPTTEKEDKLTETEFYRQLLLLIYRILFLMVAESRNLLVAGASGSGEDEEKARIYQEYYSLNRLRALAERPSYRREGFQDLWQGLRVTFSLFDESWRGQLLGLSPLNGDLFGSQTLTILQECAIDNYDLLQAIRHLSLYENKGLLRRVNYAALDVEELGSVYESLLDYTPKVTIVDGIYHFRLVTGSERKTTGSYYTPPELVAQLIKSALEPVIEDKLTEINSSASILLANSPEKLANSKNLGSETLPLPTETTGNVSILLTNTKQSETLPLPEIIKKAQETALLSLKICDPACGSGHFLLAAARRIGKELAKVRTGEFSPPPEALRGAIRHVIQHSIYGVDLNPLAVDLCKVALWIEGFCKGKPLNFLDHRIKCGNSLVGVMDLEVLKEGIPDNAFTAVTGDNKTIANSLKKRNKKEKEQEGQLSLFDFDFSLRQGNYGQNATVLDAIDESTPDGYREKQRRYQQLRKDDQWWQDFSGCNLYTCAFFMGLTEQNLQLLPTTEALKRLLKEAEKREKRSDSGQISLFSEGETAKKTPFSVIQMVENANSLAQKYRFFHWCLEFPEVFAEGGFSCVLGNPPWERIKLQEKEFFASKDDSIANAKNKAERTKLIKMLAETNPSLLQEFEDEKHFAEAQSQGVFILKI